VVKERTNGPLVDKVVVDVGVVEYLEEHVNLRDVSRQHADKVIDPVAKECVRSLGGVLGDKDHGQIFDAQGQTLLLALLSLLSLHHNKAVLGTMSKHVTLRAVPTFLRCVTHLTTLLTFIKAAIIGGVTILAALLTLPTSLRVVTGTIALVACLESIAHLKDMAQPTTRSTARNGTLIRNVTMLTTPGALSLQ